MGRGAPTAFPGSSSGARLKQGARNDLRVGCERCFPRIIVRGPIEAQVVDHGQRVAGAAFPGSSSGARLKRLLEVAHG